MDEDRTLHEREFGKKLLKELGLENQKVTRIIIDVQVNEPVRLYIERFGSRRLLDVDFSSLSDGYVIGMEDGLQAFEDDEYEGVNTA